MNAEEQDQYEQFIVPEIQRERAERLAKLEAELLGGVIGERLDRLEAVFTGNRTGFIPDHDDMEMLAWAYLDEGISLAMHSFTTGWSEKYWHRFQRFELIVKHLGESKRREIIDAMDAHQAKHRGDDWQVFKAWCKPGFWSTPADRAAVLRVADSLPEHMSDTEADRCGHEYLEILRGAQTERATNFASGSTNPEGVVPEDSNWEPAKQN